MLPSTSIAFHLDLDGVPSPRQYFVLVVMVLRPDLKIAIAQSQKGRSGWNRLCAVFRSPCFFGRNRATH